MEAMLLAGEHLSHPQLARIASDALAGLHYAHELRDYDGTPLRIVHRDVSPQNLFVTYEGQIKSGRLRNHQLYSELWPLDSVTYLPSARYISLRTTSSL